MSDSTDDVSIIAGGQSLSGWIGVRVTRSLEQMPSSFELRATEVSPFQQSAFSAQPGAPVQIKIGGDLVLTGYLDRLARSISPVQHEVRLTGRSKCEDLVDCNFGTLIAGHEVVTSGTINSLASLLAAPYGITVKSQTTGKLPDFGGQPFDILLTDTPWSVIERAARYSGVLAYDDTDGNLIISGVGTGAAGSDLVLGVNVQEATAEFSADQRFHDYWVFNFSMFPFNDTDPSASIKANAGVGHSTDPQARSPRVKTMVSSMGARPWSNGQTFADAEAQWQAARRAGRAFSLRVVTDSWRDGEGKLWAPNTYAGLNLPQLGINAGTQWVIGTVTFNRALDTGTTAELILMPQGAFLPAPEVLIPIAPPPGADDDKQQQGIGGDAGQNTGTPAPAGNTQSFAGIPGQAGSPSGPAPVRPGSGI